MQKLEQTSIDTIVPYEMYSNEDGLLPKLEVNKLYFWFCTSLQYTILFYYNGDV